MLIRIGALLCFAAAMSIAIAAQSEPELVTVNLPPYSQYARYARVQGDVKLTFTLAPFGRDPINVQAVSGHPLLKEGAIENVKTWRFDNPNNVERKYETTFRYSLDDGGAVTYESFHLVRVGTRPDVVKTNQ